MSAVEFRSLSLRPDCPWTIPAVELIYRPNPTAQDVAFLTRRGEEYYGLIEGDGLVAAGSLFMGLGVPRVESLFVAVQRQRLGHGARLLRELERVAFEDGANELQVYSLVSAIGFYSRQGYTASVEDPRLMEKGLSQS